jgi:hypothetical protein
MQVAIPSFSRAAVSLITAQQAHDKQSAKFADILSRTFQMYLDACSVAGIPRDAKSVKAIGSTIRNDERIVKAVVYDGTLVAKTVTEYAQSAMRAYFYNVPFSQGLKNDPAFVIPSESGKKRKSGSVKTTDTKALVKTLSKALEQARIMQEDATASGIVDLILEIDPTFTENTGE